MNADVDSYLALLGERVEYSVGGRTLVANVVKGGCYDVSENGVVLQRIEAVLSDGGEVMWRVESGGVTFSPRSVEGALTLVACGHSGQGPGSDVKSLPAPDGCGGFGEGTR